VIIGAPSGRLRLYAKDIDLIATGTDTKTGYVNVIANQGIELDSGSSINIQFKSKY